MVVDGGIGTALPIPVVACGARDVVSDVTLIVVRFCLGVIPLNKGENCCRNGGCHLVDITNQVSMISLCASQ
jgi:hypothetical protein